MELARWDKPIGFLLVFFPGLWALLMFGAHPLTVQWGFLFLVGAILTRGAGCTYNDMVDIDFDRHVARTRSRPLASGVVTKRQASAWIVVQLLLALGVLLCLPSQVFWPALWSMVLVALYPWAKRFTYFPQLILGFTFNWGVFLGAIAQEGTLSFKAFILYCAGICWTLGYDTIYAHQDIEDDLKVGVKSTALFWGEQSKAFITISYALFWVGLLIAAALSATRPVFYALVFPLMTVTFYRLYHLKVNNPQACLVAFKQNQYIGGLVAVGLALAKWI